ncbi:uncharacterized protein ISCGN_019169 [Ixodes scapularis]
MERTLPRSSCWHYWWTKSRLAVLGQLLQLAQRQFLQLVLLLQFALCELPAADAAVPAAVLVAGPPEAPPECVPVLAEVDDEVHLGHGVLVQKYKLSYVRGARGDSIFVKEAMKLIFGREDLHGSSVRGAMTALQGRRGQEGPDSSQVGSSQQCLQRVHMEASSRGLSREEESSCQPTAGPNASGAAPATVERVFAHVPIGTPAVQDEAVVHGRLLPEVGGKMAGPASLPVTCPGLHNTTHPSVCATLLLQGREMKEEEEFHGSM